MNDLETQPSWKDEYFDKQVTRLKVLAGVIVGIFLAGIGTVLWGDARYTRRSDFDFHVEQQKRLEKHIESDYETFASKEQLASHERMAGHPPVLEINKDQELRIRQLEKNQEWMSNAIYKLAIKNGIYLSPPPLKSE